MHDFHSSLLDTMIYICIRESPIYVISLNLKLYMHFLLFQTEMTTAERELDQNTNFDWNRIQESGQEVEPLFGPGYTGLVNLGNR